MRDSEMVASIVAGDADGLAAAYDRYADLLYKYCRSMLGDPADAADAVQDTFVVAASRLADLRDPERLRVWLYAVARNECLRIPRATRTTLALDVTDDSASAGGDAERADTATGSPLGAAGPPPGLRAHTLALAAGQDPAAVAHRAAVLSRAGSFGRDGFPRPPHGPADAAGRTRAGGALRSPRSQAAVAAGAVLAVVIAVTAFALDGGTQHGTLAGGQPTDSAHSPSVPASSGSASAATIAQPDQGSSTAATPTQAPSRPGAAAPTLSAATSTSAVPSSSAPATPAPPRSPSPVPTTASPTPTPPPSSKPAPGTLEVQPRGGPLWVPPQGAKIWLTAQGGPVTWSIRVPAGPGSVSVSPRPSTLAAGQSVQVTITASDSAFGERVTVYPGGTTFTIWVGRHHGF